MSKRIISIFLCLSLCAGFLILPAAASSISDDGLTDAGTQYINYLVGDDFQAYNSTWSDVTSPTYDYTEASRFAFKWTPDDFETGSYLLFAIRSLSRPATISVRFSTGDYLPAFYEGAIPSAGNLYFYRISMPTNPDRIEIWGSFNSSYTGTVSIASCFGVRNLLSVYDRAQFSYVAIDHKTEGDSVNKYDDVGTQFFPYSAPSWLSSTDYLTRVDFNLRCDGDRFNTSAVGKVKLLVTTYCETLRATVSLVGKDESVRDIDSIKVNISTDSAWGIVNQYAVGLGTMYNHAAYLIEFDLTGYDMANYDLQIFLSVDTVPYVSEGSIKNKLFDLTFRSMQYVPTVLNSPWYTPILSRLEYVGRVISSAVNSAVSGVTDLMKQQYTNFTTWLDQRVRNIQASISSAAMQISTNLGNLLGYDSEQKENINSSVDQNQQQQEQVQDQGDQMKDQIDQIEQAEDEMLQVPEIDPGDLELGTLIPSDGLTMMSNVMVTMTNNNYVGQVMLLVASVVLIGVMIL